MYPYIEAHPVLVFWSKSIVELGQRFSEGLNLTLEREQEEHIGMTFESIRRSSSDIGVRVPVEKHR